MARDSKPAIAPTGSEDDQANAKPAIAPTGSGASPINSRRPSECEPWREAIATLLQQGLTARRIYQDLVGEHAYTGSYYSVRRFIKKLAIQTPLPFRRMECDPGEEVQIDFGVGASILREDGKRQRTHVLRVVLSYSRKAYSEVVTRQTTELFLRALENAFWHFGGVRQKAYEKRVLCTTVTVLVLKRP